MSLAISTFTVLPVGSRPPQKPNEGFLITDNWDDWFQFNTQYFLYVADSAGEPQPIGAVKIGQFSMRPDQRRPAIPKTFQELDEQFFSVGQDDSYYDALNQLGVEVRQSVLLALRDVAAIPHLLERALKEPVTRTSLLRSVSAMTINGQFRRLALGHARLTPYDFSYTAAKMVARADPPPPLSLSFHVTPESQPATNIHVLIGRNGVGKTHFLRHMALALVRRKAAFGKFESTSASASELFANVVSVTFSAFDPFPPLAEKKDATEGIRYSYVGLQRPKTADGKTRPPKSPKVLRNEFVTSMRACQQGGEASRLDQALKTLEGDPLFRDAQVTSLSLSKKAANVAWEQEAGKVFGKLSSGHKIVLLTITRLVQAVDERTLVLLDEPEAHLHPPLLSAFIRALSDLLIQRNGVAIIATHSPVVLQEVPRTCVWILSRSGAEAKAERPEIETFGENVGVLTREAFGLEVTDAGFHKLVKAEVETQVSFEQVLQRFDNQLGAEARAIARVLTVERDARGQA